MIGQTYALAAFSAVCSLVSSSWVSDVLRILPAHSLDLVEHAVWRALSDQDEQRGAFGGQTIGEIFHESVVDADIAEGAGDGARRRPHRHAQGAD